MAVLLDDSWCFHFWVGYVGFMLEISAGSGSGMLDGYSGTLNI